MKLTKYQKDIIERVLWTAIQAAAAVFSANLAGLDPIWAVPLAAVFASIKSLAARAIGDPNSAATLPVYVEAAVTDIAKKIAVSAVKSVKPKK